MRADAPVVVSLRRDQSADSLGGSIYSDDGWMRQDNAVALDVVVKLINTVLCAELRGVSQYTAYIYLCCRCPLAL